MLNSTIIFIETKANTKVLRTKNEINPAIFNITVISSTTIRIELTCKYYGLKYKQGPFCYRILPILLNLLNSPDVLEVYYGNKRNIKGTVLTKDYLFKLIEHWIMYGENPRKCWLPKYYKINL